jgi:enamine deaminase RidA (YjgF/YER057c/UK114 family)
MNEFFFALTSNKMSDFDSEFKALWQNYLDQIVHKDLSSKTELVLRLHLSDIHRQQPLCRTVIGERNSLITMVGQAPCSGARVALEAYHRTVSHDHHLHDGDHQRQLISKNDHYIWHWSHQNTSEGEHSKQQMVEQWKKLDRQLSHVGGCVQKNTVRTWIYVRDVDYHYSGIVEGRKQYFETIGLNKSSHTIASTGIEGQGYHPHSLIQMDTLSVIGLKAEQIEYMSAPQHLGSTFDYGVTFERGTKITYGDVTHFYISGTASIDIHGQVVHPGNVILQTRRMLDNIEALLLNHGSDFSELVSCTLYLRDAADADIVLEEITKRFERDVPLLCLKAPVCRPDWLVEMEAIALKEQGDSNFKNFA